MVIVYVIVCLAVLEIAWWAHRSPVVRALLRGRGTDPSQWGSALDHLYDNGNGASWRSDGSGGDRETRVRSRHTRRR